MTPINKKVQPPSGKYFLAKLSIFIIVILLVFIMLVGSQVAVANGATEPLQGNLLFAPNLSPTVKGTATATTPATATPTRQPTATFTPTPAKPIETTVVVAVGYASLRAGPGTNYARVQDLEASELLEVLGRLDDNSYLYVKTSSGVDGWIPRAWLQVSWSSIDYYAIKTPPPQPTVIVKALGSINLHTGPSANYASLQKLASGDKLTMLGWLKDRTWLYVKTAGGQVGWVNTGMVNLGKVNLSSDYYPIQTPPPTETSTPVILKDIEGHWIDVDLSEQTVRAYDGTKLVATFLVSTGVQEHPTMTGRYRIYVKYASGLMHGSDYYLPDVPSIMYYDGDYSLHGTYWHHNFGHPMSHGCINMDIKDAKWMFDWADLGTLVNIHY